MSGGNADLDETLTGQTGAETSAMEAWATQLKLVYGRVTHPSTQNN
jgi:hypothetical protein